MRIKFAEHNNNKQQLGAALKCLYAGYMEVAAITV